MFHTRDDRAELMTYALDDGRIERIALGPLGCTCESPRWSPDDRWIVFHTRGIGRFNEHLHVVPTSGGREPALIAHASAIRGVSWLPDSSGVVTARPREARFRIHPRSTCVASAGTAAAIVR